jgi:hypothetical protein
LQNKKTNSIVEERATIEQSIFQLLRPSLALRTAMERAIQTATSSNRTRTNHAQDSSATHKHRLMALHPRVEQEMMTHRCHIFMEQNLTRVFERIGAFPAFSSVDSNHNDTANVALDQRMPTQQHHFNYDLIFVAVSASEVDRPPRTDPKAAHLKDVMIGNRDTLIHARQHGLFGGIPIFESGASTAKQVRFAIIDNNDSSRTFTAESRGVVELVASIINFFTSVSADVFIGVKGSSFSTDVFAVRHYLSKERAELHGGNYIIGPGGIEELVGPPKVHSC